MSNRTKSIRKLLLISVPCIVIIAGLLLYANRGESIDVHFAEKTKDESLNYIVAQLHSLKDYSYHSKVMATFPDGTKDNLYISMAIDSTHQRMYYDSRINTYLVVDDYIYKADHLQKTVSLFSINKRDKELAGISERLKAGLFNQVSYKMIIDSLMLNRGAVAKKELGGNQSKYWITFADNSLFKSFYLDYNTKDSVPNSIIIDSETPELGGDLKKSTIMHIECSGYSRALPDSLFATEKFFVIKEGKVIATRYKDYKLLTPQFKN